MSDTGIGARVLRKEDKRFITGKGQYTDDINLKDQTYAYFVRSPHAHATIKSINTAKAKKMPGVVDIFTSKEVEEDKIGGLICGWMIHSKDGSPMKAGPHPILASGKVRFVGDQVAVVIAETREQAKAAAQAVVVSYGVLPHNVDAAQAMKTKAQVHDVAPDNRVYNWSIGDQAATDAAFKTAAHVTKIDLINNRLIPNAMETRAAIGYYDTGTEHYTLYTTSQNPHVARLVISAFHGLAPEHKLRVIAPDVGGGFGSKIFIYGEEVTCVWASKRIGGRPIKWTADRSEAFLSDAHGRDHVSHAELAMDASGKIVGLKVHTIAAMGAYLSTFSSCVPTYLYATLLSGQYNIPNIYAEVDAVYTNTAPVDAYRGAGRPEATYLLERTVETAARELKIDPAEFRRRNFITQFPHQTPVIFMYDAGDYGAALDKALELSDYKNFASRKAASAKNGKLRGVGFSAYIEACGIAPSAAVGSLGAGVGLWESAEVRVNAVGTVEVLTGSHSHGQGHETTFAQLVSERLGRGHQQCGHRPWRHRQGADGHGHLWLALRCGRHDGDFKGAGQDRSQGEAGCRCRHGSLDRRHRLQGRHLHGEGHRQEDGVRRSGLGLPTWATSSTPRKSRSASRKPRSMIRRTSCSRRASTSAKWKWIRKPGSPRSPATRRSMISARSSIR